jgi:predicted flap endonuclease-1-like 5' DNA nuclease
MGSRSLVETVRGWPGSVWVKAGLAGLIVFLLLLALGLWGLLAFILGVAAFVLVVWLLHDRRDNMLVANVDRVLGTSPGAAASGGPEPVATPKGPVQAAPAPRAEPPGAESAAAFAAPVPGAGAYAGEAPVSADTVAGTPAGPAAGGALAERSEPDAPAAETPPPPGAAGAAPAEEVAEDVGRKPAMLDAPRDGAPDDLKRIGGIGETLEAALNARGIYHFDQIAAWTPEEVAWIDAHLVEFRGRCTRDDWVGQARQLAGGGHTDFSRRIDEGDVY